VGEDWPNDGEVDFYEEWNDSVFNQPAIHTGNSAEHGNCILDGEGQTSSVSTSNCDNTFENPPLQWQNQGCVSRDTAGPWATRTGGICRFPAFFNDSDQHRDTADASRCNGVD
jgi:hypothetical protein